MRRCLINPMIKKINSKMKKSAQNTAEFAAIMAIVIGAAIAMQTYVRRGYQEGVRYAVEKMSRPGAATQREPYYLESNFTTTRPGYTETEETKLGGGVTRVFSLGGDKTTKRSGYQKIRAPDSHFFE